MSISNTAFILDQSSVPELATKLDNANALIRSYYAFCVLCVGIVLNLISLLIYQSKEFTSSPTPLGFLYSILCIYDTVALASEVLFAAYVYQGIDITLFNSFTCKFLSMWIYFVFQFPAWQLVLIAVCINVMVCYPTKLRKFDKRFFICATAVVWFILFLSCIGYYWNVFVPGSEGNPASIFVSKNTNVTLNNCLSINHLDFFNDCFHIVKLMLIPFGLLLYLSITTIRAIKVSNKIRKPGTKNKSNKLDRQFTSSVIAMCLLFLIIYGPLIVVFIFSHVNDFLRVSFINPVYGAALRMALRVGYCYSYISNFSVFFVSYKYNSIFRRKVDKAIFKH